MFPVMSKGGWSFVIPDWGEGLAHEGGAGLVLLKPAPAPLPCIYSLICYLSILKRHVTFVTLYAHVDFT